MIETKRLRIEPFEMGHLEAYSIGFDNEVTKYQYPDPFESIDDAREFLLGFIDSIPSSADEDFKPYQITSKIMALANKDAVLNPCPPFYRGEEVSEEAIDSKFFVGYGFKESLLVVQQAIMVYCMTH